MAATVTFDSGPTGRGVIGDRFVRRGTIQLGTYAAGGVAVSKSTFDLPVSLDDLRVDPAGGYVFRWNTTTAKVQAYLNKDPGAVGGADLALPEVGAVDISAAVARYVATGK